MTEGYSPSWEKLNLVPEGEVTLEPEEKGELAAVSCRPPAEWDRNHSFASSWVRSWEVGIYLDRRKSSWDYLRTTLTKMNSVEMTMNIYQKMILQKKSDHYTSWNLRSFSKSFLLPGRLWGNLQFLSVWREYTKENKIGECSKKPSLGVSVTCWFMTVSCQSPHLDRTEATKRAAVRALRRL